MSAESTINEQIYNLKKSHIEYENIECEISTLGYCSSRYPSLVDVLINRYSEMSFTYGYY